MTRSLPPLPDHLVAMVRRLPPATAPVVTGSTPVIAFGDPAMAEVATLGINPSKVEFVDSSGPLTGSKRRLANLESLNANDLLSLTDLQVRRVLHESATYFTVNPYRKWFDPLDRLLSDAVGASYYEGTACHLDLVQWATDPLWSQLPVEVQQALLDDGVPHLQAQLRHDNVRLVLLNGRTVLNQVQALGLASLVTAGKLPVGKTTCTLYGGHAEGVRFLGWSTNLQASYGVSKAFKAELARWLAEQATALETADSGAPTVTAVVPASPLVLDQHGHLPKGTTVVGKHQLAALLAAWLDYSDAATIGEVGSFGGSAWIRIQLGDHTAVLNRDTKRHAIFEYINDTRRRGADTPWWVVPNRNGVINKLAFRGDGEGTPGWYCYLTEPLPASTPLP